MDLVSLSSRLESITSMQKPYIWHLFVEKLKKDEQDSSLKNYTKTNQTQQKQIRKS